MEQLVETIISCDINDKAIGRIEKAERDADSSITKSQDIIFKRTEVSGTEQIKVYMHNVCFRDAKVKIGQLDDTNMVSETEMERRAL